MILDADLTIATLTEYDADGFLGIQCDAYAEEGHGVTPFHSLQPLGLHARASDPDGEKGVLCLRWTEGAEGFSIPFGDTRVEGPLPDLEKGSVCLHDVVDGKHRLTLDHKNKLAHLEVPSGSTFKVTVGNVLIEVTADGTIKLGTTTATAVECAGVEPLAKHAPLAPALNAIGAALTALAGVPINASAGAGPATSAVTAIGTYAASGATLKLKGS